MKTLTFKVSRQDKDRSLLDFLVGKLNVSRRQAKRHLDTRSVLVNKRRVWMAHHTLNAGDDVQVLITASERRTEGRIEILFEDEYFLVADKPAGVLSNGPESIEETLAAQTANADIAAAHRLDRDTSGCLLFAKRPDSLELADRLIRDAKVQKVYHAIVAGMLRTDSTRIARPLDGQHALTLVRTLDANPEASHLAVRIETGRTHQIRKHLASLHHPVLGDRQYGGAVLANERFLQVPRQMLHATSLEFVHPVTGQVRRVESALPRDFRSCLRAFRLT